MSRTLWRIAPNHSTGMDEALPIDETPAEIRLALARNSWPSAYEGAVTSMTPPERVPYCTGKPPLKTSMRSMPAGSMALMRLWKFLRWYGSSSGMPS